MVGETRGRTGRGGGDLALFDLLRSTLLAGFVRGALGFMDTIRHDSGDADGVRLP